MLRLYNKQLLAISDMLKNTSKGIRDEAYDLLFRLWRENADSVNFIQDLIPIALEHEVTVQELSTRLNELSLKDALTDSFLREHLARLAAEVAKFKPDAIKVDTEIPKLPPINITISENQRTKFTWWQLALIIVIIFSLGLILVLQQPFQKSLVIVVASCCAVFLYYIVPKRDRTILTDLSNIKLSYTSPSYLSVGDENTIYIAVENSSQNEFNGKITLIFNDPDSLVIPAPDQSLSTKVEVSSLGKEAKQFKFLLLKKPSDGNLNYYFQISSDKSQYVSNEEKFQIAPIPYLRSTWAWLFGSAGLGALIIALLWELLEKRLLP